MNRTTVGPGWVPVSHTTLALADGKKLFVWSSLPKTDAESTPVAIVAQGFGRRMLHSAGLARHLVECGFSVYRCDYVNHVGLSDGGINDFTISSAYESLKHLIDHAKKASSVERVVIVSTSLSARVTFRLAAERDDISGIVAIVGVVNTRKTLAKVFGTDHGARPPETVPPEEFVSFEGKSIRGRTFSEDWHGQNWLEVETTAQELSATSCPIVNFCGSEDDWVDVDEVERVFTESGSNCRLVRLPFVQHELTKNPVAARRVLAEVGKTALSFTGKTDSDVSEPSFSMLAGQIPYERRMEKELQGKTQWRISTIA